MKLDHSRAIYDTKTNAFKRRLCINRYKNIKVLIKQILFYTYL